MAEEKQTIAAILAVLALTATARDGGNGEEHRRSAAVREFKRQQPCPATGQARGPCPGWVVDHRMPLCAGGEDHPSNMAWQTVAEAKTKDAEERRLCRSLKR